MTSLGVRPRDSFTLYRLTLVLMHVAAAVAVVLEPATISLWLVVLLGHWLTGGIGICLGYHRYLAHRAFSFRYQWTEYLAVTLGALSFQGGPVFWVGTHRAHHAHPDSSRDPYARKGQHGTAGFIERHLGWIFYREEAFNARELACARDIMKVPYFRFLERNFLWLQLLLLVVIAIFSLKFAVWAVCVRAIVTCHCTWLVNSLCHGDTPDKALRDETWRHAAHDSAMVALLTYGEGWHFKHHNFPRNACHGFGRWWEIDLTYLEILALKKIGLVTAIQGATG